MSFDHSVCYSECSAGYLIFICAVLKICFRVNVHCAAQVDDTCSGCTTVNLKDLAAVIDVTEIFLLACHCIAELIDCRNFCAHELTVASVSDDIISPTVIPAIRIIGSAVEQRSPVRSCRDHSPGQTNLSFAQTCRLSFITVCIMRFHPCHQTVRSGMLPVHDVIDTEIFILNCIPEYIAVAAGCHSDILCILCLRNIISLKNFSVIENAVCIF